MVPLQVQTGCHIGVESREEKKKRVILHRDTIIYENIYIFEK